MSGVQSLPKALWALTVFSGDMWVTKERTSRDAEGLLNFTKFE